MIINLLLLAFYFGKDNIFYPYFLVRNQKYTMILTVKIKKMLQPERLKHFTYIILILLF